MAISQLEQHLFEFQFCQRVLAPLFPFIPLRHTDGSSVKSAAEYRVLLMRNAGESAKEEASSVNLSVASALTLPRTPADTIHLLGAEGKLHQVYFTKTLCLPLRLPQTSFPDLKCFASVFCV